MNHDQCSLHRIVPLAIAWTVLRSWFTLAEPLALNDTSGVQRQSRAYEWLVLCQKLQEPTETWAIITISTVQQQYDLATTVYTAGEI